MQALIQRRSVFTLSVAASYCKKGSLAYFNKASGDDAYLKSTWIIPGPMQGTTLLGVCDGVGGWKRYNLDAGALSRALCEEMTHNFEQHESGSTSPALVSLLESGFDRLQSAGDAYAGGTTACFGIFNPQTARMDALNIGDSGLIVLRRGSVVYSTERDAVGMVPKQLAIPPSYLVKDRLKQYEEYKLTLKVPAWMDTTPRDAVPYDMQLRHGDILIFGSDGLYDNMYPHKILDAATQKLLELEAWTDDGELAPAAFVSGAKELSEMLVKKAYYLSLDMNYASPFATRSFQEGLIFPGGKPDDITVVVGIVNGVELDEHV